MNGFEKRKWEGGRHFVELDAADMRLNQMQNGYDVRPRQFLN